jgi:hypothetical protein
MNQTKWNSIVCQFVVLRTTGIGGWAETNIATESSESISGIRDYPWQIFEP